MNSPHRSRQLQLFSGEQPAWETLPDDCQQSVRQLLSLLVEQVRNQQHQQSQSTNPLTEADPHV